jgi:hypothetical protein
LAQDLALATGVAPGRGLPGALVRAFILCLGRAM